MLYIMVKETQGERLKRLIEENHTSQKKLAKDSGVSRALINQIAGGKKTTKNIEILTALGDKLGVSAMYLMGLEEEDSKTAAQRTIEEIKEMLRTAEQSEVKREIERVTKVPTLGHVPCGYPLPNEQESGLDPIYVSNKELGPYTNTAGLFALIITGDSMIGDGIYPGSRVVINPNDKEIVQGKIYLVRIENAVTIKHLVVKKGRPVLQASNGEYKDILPDQLEVIGRVIWKGTGEAL